jgi:sec-independent protein translocase protein TatA
MGPVGVQEMVVIFLVALVLFGPRKLPELGRTIGKAITEFRRAQSELKSTFESHMRELEKESESLREVTRSYTNDIYNHYNGYDEFANPSQPQLPEATPSSDSTTATETGVESLTPGEPAPALAPEGAPVNGTVARNSNSLSPSASEHSVDEAKDHAASESPAAEPHSISS